MAEQLARDLWRLEIPLEGSPLKTLNSYFVRGERSLLIDTGFRWDSCRAACERQLEELGADRDRMDIFITHLHSDHVGLAPDLIRPGCRIFIGEVDGPGVADYMDETAGGTSTPGISGTASPGRRRTVFGPAIPPRRPPPPRGPGTSTCGTGIPCPTAGTPFAAS